MTRTDGAMVRLGDVARVKDGFEDTDIKPRFNGRPAVMVVVKRTDSQDTIAISNRVLEYLKAHRKDMPKGVELGHWYNMADLVQDRIDLLLKNGLQGFILVFVVLALFLNLGLAFWVASGIPITFMGAFLVLDYMGASINMLSMFGFIMTLGILVDDAIIVGENVYFHYSMGKTPKQAVVDSMAQIGWPVVMAVATTIVAFTPLMYIVGIMGKFISIMPQAVICILAISLVEAFLILPAHLEGALTPAVPQKRSLAWKMAFFWLEWLKTDVSIIHDRLRSRVEKMLNQAIQGVYLPLLGYCVKNRYFTLAGGAVASLSAWG